jgi:hypothetical protein
MRETTVCPNHGGIWRTMRCRLCINSYGTLPRPPQTQTLTISGSVTINAKATIHCSPGLT